MRALALLGVAVALLVSVAVASGGSVPPQEPPSVRIARPAAGTVAHADVIAVDVAWTAAPRVGKVHTLTLELDGREVARHVTRNPGTTGSQEFTVELHSVAEGPHTLRAFAYQGHARGNAPGASLPVTFVVDRVGGGLEGDPDEPALTAVHDVFEPTAYVAPDELSGATVRTQVELVFARDATVGDVNALLRDIGGRIVSQREGVLIAVVRIPDPGSLDALDALLASLAGSPALRAANPVTTAATAELPAIIDPGTTEVEFVRHQLAVRAHAAWNARDALDSVTPPTFVLGDSFGNGAPGTLFGLSVRDEDYAGGLGGSGHGYHVLGIAATGFDPTGGPLPTDAVTGMYPGSLDVRAVDIALLLPGATLQDRLLEEVEDATGQVVVNTSLQAPCETPANATRYCTGDEARARGLAWLERVRGTDPSSSLEGKFVHITAAGNRAPDVAPQDAAIGGWDSASAALYPIFVGGGPDPLVRVPNLTNTLVVESFASSAAEPFTPECRSTLSDAGGTIAAIGESVHSFVSPTTTATHSGTSMATPQVAGLAAYVWALRPGLSPAELIALLQRTAVPADASCGSTAPVIDAYSAVLAADEGNAARPVRLAILDAADASGGAGRNGRFDEFDLARHLDKLVAAAGAIDYGRHDLNGDGRTGAESATHRTARLDLDADGSFGAVEQEVEGVPVRFDEAHVSDRKALCYFAYSPLYGGDPGARTATLGPAECVRLGVDTLFPTTVQPGIANALTVVVVDRDLPGPFVPQGQAGVTIELTPVGGTVAHFAGTTNADGVFRTTATAFAGQPLLTVEVVARAADGTELGRAIVRANVTAGPDLRGIWEGGGTCGDIFFAAQVRVTRSVEGPLAASFLATTFNGGLIARQQSFGIWLLDEAPDGTFTSSTSFSGRPETISLRLDAVGSGRFGAGILRGRVTAESPTGICGDFGEVYEFTAELQQR